MTVLQALDEGDIYLYCILTDPSGVDLAEFCFPDPEREDQRWRAYSYQWPWFRCQDSFQVERGSRSVGKSMSIILRAAAFIFCYPQAQMVISAPTEKHLKRITDLIEDKFSKIRLIKELLPKRANLGFTHKPFKIVARNSAYIEGMIPQLDGSGAKGVHPLVLEVDELQDYPPAGFTELIETVKQDSEHFMWRNHGVSTGARDWFHKITQPGGKWTVHTPVAIDRPGWTDAERQQKIATYGSRNDPDYRRNVFGEHGNSENPLFVMNRLLKCLDFNKSSEYNQDIYTTIAVRAEQLEDYGGGIADLIPIPASHKQKWKTFWIGADLGFTQDPTEILVFGESTPKDGDSVLTLLLRVNLTRIRHQDQAEAMAHLIMKYGPGACSLDKTGLGLPLFQDLQDRFPSLAAKVRGYNFSEKLIVEFDQTIEVDPEMDDEIEKTKIVKNVLEHSSDVLRDLVDGRRLVLPDDDDVINSFKGETFSAQKKVTDLYGRRKFRNTSKSHVLDAARMMAMGWSQAKIEPLLDRKKEPDEIIIPQWA